MNTTENNYIIEIKNGLRRVFWHKRYFLNHGFCFAKRKFGKSFYYKNYITKEECNQYRKFCRLRMLKMYIYRREYTRSNNYRKTFFDNKTYAGPFTLCAYCGFPLRISKITVDHIIPVHATKTTGSGKLMMRMFHIKNVNDYRNLCAAHKHCNSKKGSKTGLWIVRGYIGKSVPLWIFRWAVRIVAVVTVATYLSHSAEIKRYIYFLFEKGIQLCF